MDSRKPQEASPWLERAGAGRPSAGPGAVDTIECVDTLLRAAPTLEPSASAGEAVRLFSADSTLGSLPVVDANRRAVGMLHRYAVLAAFATPYGHALYADRPVTDLVAGDSVIVRADTALEVLSERITDQPGGNVDEDFIIVDGYGRYCGVGTVIDLLRRMTELRVRSAQHANPLSGLPGNVPFDQRLDRLIGADTGFVALYCDLDHFKAYNDRYGYASGDTVIRYLAERLREHFPSAADFVAHIGGDDFAVATTSPAWQAACDALIADFDASVGEFYDADDRARGGFEARDRQGQAVFEPLMGVSIGAVPVRAGTPVARQTVAARLAEVKCKAKFIAGSALFVERRRAGR